METLKNTVALSRRDKPITLSSVDKPGIFFHLRGSLLIFPIRSITLGLNVISNSIGLTAASFSFSTPREADKRNGTVFFLPPKPPNFYTRVLLCPANGAHLLRFNDKGCHLS